ncbi:MAG TPA: winged helix-turn-helix domain-containing protein [Solirubrobacterales bacterium]|nr:winged helix-turn-helix domain-containing protein [Solirubrobacterales bacterium]
MASDSAERYIDSLKRNRGRKQRKRIEEAVQYALAHKIRLEILVILNEGCFTNAEIAELLGLEAKYISNHVLRMLEDGSIEIAKQEQRRGTMVYWYRAVELPEYSKEEAEGLTEMELQLIAGVVVQSATAELMAALNKGTLASARAILSWDLYSVDSQGRTDIEVEVERHLERLKEIQCESVNRVAVSKGNTTSMIVSAFAFERAREILRPLLVTKP